jgi:NADPH:quinone reductase-like Zn-dependent oxidoreductase
MRVVTVTLPVRQGQIAVTAVNTPESGQDDVLIEVAAAEVNHADLLQRAGSYPRSARAPRWPKVDAPGRVKTVPHGVSPQRVGRYVQARRDSG